MPGDMKRTDEGGRDQSDTDGCEGGRDKSVVSFVILCDESLHRDRGVIPDTIGEPGCTPVCWYFRYTCHTCIQITFLFGDSFISI